MGSTRSLLTIYYQNASGLRTKLSTVTNKLHSLTLPPDVIVFTETNLAEDIADGELGLLNFHTYRCNRNTLTSSRSSGGSVLIAVNKFLFSWQVQISCNTIEQLFVRVANNSSHATSVEEVSRLFPNDEIIVVGDYNLPNALWHNHNGISASDTSYVPPNLRDGISQLCSSFSFLQMSQWFSVHPTKSYTLYLFSTVPRVEFCDTQDELFKTDQHHQHLLFKLPHLTTKNLQSCETFYDFKNANYADINNMLSNVNWIETLFCNSICENADSLSTTLNNIISCTMTIKRRFIGKFTIWYTNDLKTLILEKRTCSLVLENF